MDFNNIYILICMGSALIGSGFSAGLLLGKYQSKEKCECLRKQYIEAAENKISLVKQELKESLERVHERLDNIFEKISKF